MSARYRTKVSDELIEAWDVSHFPVGLRIVEIGPLNPATRCYEVTFDDDGAPEELNDQMVTPLFQVQPDRSVVIVGRDIDP